MPALDDSRLRQLAGALRDSLRAVAPDWTAPPAGDPGITLLQAFAYLAESLHHRVDQLTPRERELLRLLLPPAAAAADDCAPRRVRWVDGLLLTASDLQAEQDYLRARLRRLTLNLHGSGIVSGLQVSVESGRRAAVVVAPGFAVDPRGEELALCAPLRRPLPASGSSLLVRLALAEQGTAPAPAISSDIDDAPVQATRIVETAVLALVAGAAGSPDAPAALTIARLNFSRGQWRVDRRFRAPRLKR